MKCISFELVYIESKLIRSVITQAKVWDELIMGIFEKWKFN